MQRPCPQQHRPIYRWTLLILLLTVLGLSGNRAQADSPGPYGKVKVATYDLPLTTITALNESVARQREPGGHPLYALTREWQGEPFSPLPDGNPYRMVIQVSGRVLSHDEVVTRWQPMWNNRGPLMGSIRKLNATAGDLIRIEGASPPVSFKSHEPVTPVLGLTEARNIELIAVKIEIWSGFGQSGWSDSWFVWIPLLTGLLFLAFRIWSRSQ